MLIQKILRSSFSVILCSFLVFTCFAQDNQPVQQAQNNSAKQILLNVVVKNKQGQVLKGVPKENFAVFEGDKQQEITTFAEQDTPTSIGILFDNSGSMSTHVRGDKVKLLENFTRFLSTFIQESNPANDYFLMSFNATSKLATDWTQDEKAVIDGLKNTFAIHGPTAFYDACQVALAKLSQSKHQKQALLIFTDGHDNTSRLGFDELRRFIQQSRAMIYLVNLIQFPELLVPFGQVEPRETVEISGGDAFFLQDESKINELAGSIALELRRQYTIGFRPTVADKKWHSIKVKVSPIEVTDKGKPNSPPQKITPTVRTRKGYFAN